MKKKHLWFVFLIIVLALLFGAGCTPGVSSEAGNDIPSEVPTGLPTATPQVKPTTVPTLAPTRTHTATPVILATSTESVSGFQRMIRSMPTAEFVAGFYPDSVEILYYDSPVRINNFTFSFSHEMEKGLYLDKRFDMKNQWAAFEGYHPWPDYTIALYAEFVDENKTLAELQEISMEDLLASAQRFGVVQNQSAEIISIDGEQAVLTSVTLVNSQGYLEFLTLDSLHLHVQGGQLEVSMMTAFLQDSEENLENLAGDVLAVLHDIYRSFDTQDWENVLTYNYTLFTGVCPTETDPSYGYTEENPIRMVILDGTDSVSQAFSGPYMANAYFETLLYQGEAVSFVREGSVTTDTTILDVYRVSAPGMTEPVILYVDQYNRAPYTVPMGFECSGLMYPDLFIEQD
ncbi:MAG: hypothetical protein HPY85_01065 [Anaerolineae bacterium]|nr:hypothetical protein [Anaerolineae bacterium]